MTNRDVPLKACHLPFELEHNVYWIIQQLNFDAKVCGKTRLFKLNELDEVKLNAYENVKLYKERTKV